MVGQINIVGIIGKDVGLIDVISQVGKQKGATSYDVLLNSKGGNVNEGYNIYNYLVSLGLPINMIGVNTVASIATVIFMAGNTRRIEKNTNFFIHLPSIPQLENATAQDLENYSKEMRIVEKKVIDFYIDKTGLKKEAIEPMLENQTYLTESQLFEMGFTTEQSSLPVEAVAFLDTNINPLTMNKNKKKQAQSIISMIKSLFDGTAEMKMVLTADQKELVFPDLEEDAVIKIGDKALLEDAPAEGEIVLADGSSLVFEAEKVIDIKPKVEEDKDTEEVAQLKAQIKTLTDEKQAQASKETALQTKINTVNNELKDAKKVLKKIEGIQSEMLEVDKKKNKNNIKNRQSDISNDIQDLLNL